MITDLTSPPFANVLPRLWQHRQTFTRAMFDVYACFGSEQPATNQRRGRLGPQRCVVRWIEKDDVERHAAGRLRQPAEGVGTGHLHTLFSPFARGGLDGSSRASLFLD